MSYHRDHDDEEDEDTTLIRQWGLSSRRDEYDDREIYIGSDRYGDSEPYRYNTEFTSMELDGESYTLGRDENGYVITTRLRRDGEQEIYHGNPLGLGDRTPLDLAADSPSRSSRSSPSGGFGLYECGCALIACVVVFLGLVNGCNRLNDYFMYQNDLHEISRKQAQYERDHPNRQAQVNRGYQARRLKVDSLRGKSKFELDVMRNQPYARHGLRFRRKDLRDYFEKQPWYSATTSDADAVDRELSDVEKANVQTILKYQQKRRR